MAKRTGAIEKRNPEILTLWNIKLLAESEKIRRNSYERALSWIIILDVTHHWVVQEFQTAEWRNCIEHPRHSIKTPEKNILKWYPEVRATIDILWKKHLKMLKKTKSTKGSRFSTCLIKQKSTFFKGRHHYRDCQQSNIHNTIVRVWKSKITQPGGKKGS